MKVVDNRTTSEDNNKNQTRNIINLASEKN